jgi:hypothetical protein
MAAAKNVDNINSAFSSLLHNTQGLKHETSCSRAWRPLAASLKAAAADDDDGDDDCGGF